MKKRPRLRVGDTVKVIRVPQIDPYHRYPGKKGIAEMKVRRSCYWVVRFPITRYGLSFCRSELKLVKRGKK